jgi:hypothetical protein
MGRPSYCGDCTCPGFDAAAPVDPTRYPFHVYPGSEKLDLGPKGEPQALCRSREQAAHMAKAWGEFGYYEEVK